MLYMHARHLNMAETPSRRCRAMKKNKQLINFSSKRRQQRNESVHVGCNGTGFSARETKERACLFKDEYNQADLHDRVLVLQVMPDDYELCEVTARLNQCATRTALNEAHSDVSCEVVLTEIDDLQFYENTSEAKEEKLSAMAGKSRGLDFDVKDAFPRSQDEEEEEKYVRPEFSYIQDRERFLCSTVSTSKSTICGDKEDIGDDTPSKVTEIVEEASYNEVKEEVEDIGCFEEVNSLPLAENPVPKRRILPEVAEAFEESESEKENVIEGECNTFDSPAGCSKKPRIINDLPAVHLEEIESKDTSLVGRGGVNEIEDGGTSSVHALREHRIYVHACWLAVNSLYFRSLLFESGMKECSSLEFCMKVAESDERAFMLLLQSIYDPDVLDDVEITLLMSVLRLSVKYDVRFSMLKARRVLESVPLTLSICEEIIRAVQSGGLPDLGGIMKNVEDLLLSEFAPLDETWESEKFASLSEPALRFLLGSDRLVVQSENTVFIALMQWIAKNAEICENDFTEYSDLLGLVRFEIMKPTYIHDVVQEHPIATKVDNFDTLYLKAITYHALPQKRRKTGINNRQWCDPQVPTFTWILYPEPDLFNPDEITSAKSSSFWYFGYRMHLQLDFSPKQQECGLYLVVENLSQDGSVQLAYDVDVKFGDSLHRSFTSEPFLYQEANLPPPTLNYPFDEKYSLDEIKEILLGGSMKVAITFEVTVEKLLE